MEAKRRDSTGCRIISAYKGEWLLILSQIDAIIRAIPAQYLLAPPDGGDVTVAEGVQRMAADIKRLRAALEDIASGKHSSIRLLSCPPQDPAVNRARAALEKKA